MITKILAKYDPVASIKVGSFKKNVKRCLLGIQCMFDTSEWCDKNFELETAIKLRLGL